MAGVGTLIGTPVGILAGTYLAEYGQRAGWRRPRASERRALSAPSIIIGLFIYAVYVAQVGHYWLGRRHRAVHPGDPGGGPHHRQHAAAGAEQPARAAALGCPAHDHDVCYRAAKTGIITGVLLAIARISGETAPLLFTALSNQFMSLNMNGPMANLPS